MEDLDESCGLLPRILRELFERIDGSQEYAVGISCWEMLCNESVDLLKPFHRAQKTDESPSSSFGVSSSMSNFASPGLLVEQSPLPHLPGSGLACIEVRSMEDARAALNHSRAHSANWYVDSKSESFCTLPNRAHAFVRVMLYSKVQRRVSCINVVDLVGSQSLAARGGGASSSPSPRPSASPNTGVVPRDLLSQHERERKTINQQLLAFSRLVSEIAQTSDDARQRELQGETLFSSPGSASLIHLSARDSTLTKELAPLLAGNAQCFMVNTVSATSKDYIDTANSLRVAMRFARMSSACSKFLNVPPEALRMTPLSKVLSYHEILSTRNVEGGLSPKSHTNSHSHSHSHSHNNSASTSGMKGASSKPPSSASAEIVHLTLNQVASIEELADKIMRGYGGSEGSPGREGRGRDGGPAAAAAMADAEITSQERDAALRRLEALKAQLLSPSSSHSSPEEASRDGGIHAPTHTRKPSADLDSVSSATQAKLDCLKESFREMYTELDIPGGDTNTGTLIEPSDLAEGRLLSPYSHHSGRASSVSAGSVSQAPRPSAPTPAPTSAHFVAHASVHAFDAAEGGMMSTGRGFEFRVPAGEHEETSSSAGDGSGSAVATKAMESFADIPPPAPPTQEAGERGEREERGEGRGEGLERYPTLARWSAGATREGDEAGVARASRFAAGMVSSGVGGAEGSGARAGAPEETSPGDASTGTTTAGGEDASDAPAMVDVAELQRSYNGLLKMVEREREARNGANARIRALERDLLETSTELSAQADGLRVQVSASPCFLPLPSFLSFAFADTHASCAIRYYSFLFLFISFPFLIALHPFRTSI